MSVGFGGVSKNPIVYGELMKNAMLVMTAVAGLFMAQVALAQAPAGSTGICKDGTYTTAPSKKGACRGHKGVKTWLSAEATTTAAAKTSSRKAKAAAEEKAAPAQAAMPAAAPAAPEMPAKRSSRTSAASMTQAAGGGAGMVWVNSATNVYHCEGSKYYGKTKAGSYMTEAQAKAKGAHADHNHPCSK